MAHARLSPSNHRWPHCPGSIREEANYQDIPGKAAIDGTGSHALLELCIDNNVKADEYQGLIIGSSHKDAPDGWRVDSERCNRVQICLNYIERRKKELTKQFPGCLVSIESESRSNPGAAVGRDDWWGTCDITIIAVLNDKIILIEVVDYKDGRGYVSEKDNPQLIAYLYGKITERVKGTLLDELGLRMTIVQPKTGIPIRYQDVTVPYLNNKVEGLVEAASKTDDPNAPLISGKHCTWCKHNPKRGGVCTALVDKSIGVIMTDEISDSLLGVIQQAVKDVKSMTPEQLTEVADAEAGFLAAFDKVRDEIRERIETGQDVPGYAMKPGRIKKVWNIPEDELVKKLKAKRIKTADIYPSKLITPAAALKLPGLTDTQRKKVSELVDEVTGDLKLKKVSYKSENVEEMFNELSFF